MKLSNRFLEVSLTGDRLEILNRDTGSAVSLAWPAVALSIKGKTIVPKRPASNPRFEDNAIAQDFETDDFCFSVRVTLADGPWIRKNLLVVAERSTVTPDYVEVDRQSLVADNLSARGYRPLSDKSAGVGEEEADGGELNRGYPLIGDTIFTGLEHPAAFCDVSSERGREQYFLRHFPVWDENRALQDVGAVFGLCASGERGFADYLRAIRLKPRQKLFATFCTFWTDPYLGDYNYGVSYDAYVAFIKAFKRLGLIPDSFMLDAGWNDRWSIFAAKAEMGGEDGLRKIAKRVHALGSSLGLWVSHNGPVGIAPEYSREQGYETGGGKAFAYCGDNYSVMMDERFAEAVQARFEELIRDVGAAQLKIDWDNERATNPRFQERYPTHDHVCQASLNVFFRIGRALRDINPDVLLRNGWNPSPWWLCEVNHIWLTHSADSDYASLPARNQRDAAQTHRDLMYYYILRRDKSPLPLDCFDNHEFPDAFRNPFANAPGDWANACWMAFGRGSAYVALTLQPESLEDWQAQALRQVMAFARANEKHLFTDRGKMVLGNPGEGEIYGFANPGKNETWCVLRNPAPVPQALVLRPAAIAEHPVRSVVQFYPHFKMVAPDAPAWEFLPHEVKFAVFSSKNETLPFAAPFMAFREKGKFLYRFPASMTLEKTSVAPMADPLHRIEGLTAPRREIKRENDRLVCRWMVCVPYRFRDAEVAVRITGPNAAKVRLSAATSRYYEMGASYAAPVTRLEPSDPGYGEMKNKMAVSGPRPQYFYVRVPDGGEFGLRLVFDGVSRDDRVDAWVYGYEAPSREAVEKKRFVKRFSDVLPYPFPRGFGKVLALPIE